MTHTEMPTHVDPSAEPDQTSTRGRIAHSRWFVRDTGDGAKVYAEVSTIHTGRPVYQYSALIHRVTVRMDRGIESRSFVLTAGTRLPLVIEAPRYSAAGLREAHAAHVRQVREEFARNHADFVGPFAVEAHDAD